MRTDLTPAFIDELSHNGRYPFQYLVFHFSSGDIVVSDISLPGLNSLPIIEDWGDLTDVVNVDDAVKGNGSPTRQLTVSLFNTKEYIRKYVLLPNGDFKDWTDSTHPDEWELDYPVNDFTFDNVGGLHAHSDVLDTYNGVTHTLRKPILHDTKIRITVTSISVGATIYIINDTHSGSIHITEAGVHEINLPYNHSSTIGIGGYNDIGAGYDFVIESIEVDYDYDLFQDPRTPFASLFNNEAPENIAVSLYQGFKGINDVVLIGTFLAQDPIQYSEKSALLSLDLVSQNQYADPFVGEFDSVTNTYPDIIIGENSQIPGITHGVFPFVTLAEAITETQPTLKTNASSGLETLGFPTTGKIEVDFERIDYDGFIDSGVGYNDTFNHCIRGVDTTIGPGKYSKRTSHKSGASICLSSTTSDETPYTFSFGAGPVDNMGPVYINGVIYTGGYIVHPELDPIQITFLRSPPFLKIEDDTLHTKDVTDLGTVTNQLGSIFNVEYAGLRGICDSSDRGAQCNYRPVGTNELYGSFDYTFTNTWDNTDAYRVFKHGDFYIKGEVIAYDMDPGPGILYSQLEFNSNSWIYPSVIIAPNTGSGTTVGENTFSFDNVFLLEETKTISFINPVDRYEDDSKWAGSVYCVHVTIYYVCELREAHITNITCDVNSAAGVVLPVDAIKTMLTRIGIASYIDQTSYNIVHDIQVAKNYSFSALIKGDKRCREAIKDMCTQSRTTLIYNAGKIKFAYRYTLDDLTPSVNFISTPANTQLKSISIVRQNVADIVNRGTILFDPTIAEEDYQNSIVREVPTSITEFGLHEKNIEAYLIDTGPMAQDIIDYLVDENATPYMIITFNLYMDAFALEPEDIIQLNTKFSGLTSVRCRVINIKRTFGSGKINKINTFEITCVTHYNTNTIFASIKDIPTMKDSITGTLS